MPDWNDWPEVPHAQRPKALYHSLLLPQEAINLLKSKGWDPTDVRLMPSDSDSERRLRVRAYLEGLINGTIEVTSPKMYDFIELEAKSCGDVGNKQASIDPKSSLKSEEVTDLLNIGSKRTFAGRHDAQEALAEISKPKDGKKVAKKGTPTS